MMGIIIRPTVQAEREQEEGATYHGIVRYTHVRCGYTTRIRGEMELLNDLDPACPRCSPAHRDCFPDCNAPYGAMVWENADGTIVETYSDGQELKRWQPVRTHVQIYKSWTNAPDTGEWWIVPRPNTGDIDGSDNLIVGFDTYEHALAALPNLRSTFNDLAHHQGVAWRDRRDPIYQPTPPKEEPVPNTDTDTRMTPLPPGSTREGAQRELDALAGCNSLLMMGAEFTDDEHTEVWLDWAAQIRVAWGFPWAEALTIARVWYFG